MQQTKDVFARIRAVQYNAFNENADKLEHLFDEFIKGGNDLLANNDKLQIGIVGQVKAGKSSFLNSLFFKGKNILPKASIPMTAGLTVIEYGEKNNFVVEYFARDEWNQFESDDRAYCDIEAEVKRENPDAPLQLILREIESRAGMALKSAHEMVSRCTSRARDKIGASPDSTPFYDIDELQNIFEQYVGARGEYTSVVKSLHLYLNDPVLKGLCIVDTPGVNDPVASRENRTRELLQTSHGVFLLSLAGSFLSAQDVSFLNKRIGGRGIGTVVILASQIDSVIRGMEYKGKPLDEVVDDVKRKFKKRIQEHTDIDERLRKNLRFDTTAAIGYGIAQKEPNQRDAEETHVAQQMREYFPDYFDTEEELKQTFMELANIDEIRDKYLENVFIKNKERIVADKVDNFFECSQKDLREALQKNVNQFEQHAQNLKEATIEKINKQREEQGALFDRLSGEFKSVFRHFGNKLQAEIRSIGNQIDFPSIRIPMSNEMRPVPHKGFMGLGHTTSQFYLDAVDNEGVRDIWEKAVRDYTRKWNTCWKSLVQNQKAEINSKLNEKITEQEKALQSSTFESRFYRNLITDTLDEIQLYEDVNLKPIQKRAGDAIRPHINKMIRLDDKKIYNSGEAEAKRLCQEKYDQAKRDLDNQLYIAKDQVEREISGAVEEQMKNIIKHIEQLESDFADKIKENGEKYLKQLEEEAKQKTEVLEKVQRVMSLLKELQTLYA